MKNYKTSPFYHLGILLAWIAWYSFEFTLVAMSKGFEDFRATHPPHTYDNEAPQAPDPGLPVK